MQRRNLKEYPSDTVYRELRSYTPEKFAKEWEKRIRKRPTVLVIVGDLKHINKEALKDFGKVSTLTLDEIFRK